MATVVKDFKVKAGLVVEGATGTINERTSLEKMIQTSTLLNSSAEKHL